MLWSRRSKTNNFTTVLFLLRCGGVVKGAAAGACHAAGRPLAAQQGTLVQVAGTITRGDGNSALCGRWQRPGSYLLLQRAAVCAASIAKRRWRLEWLASRWKLVVLQPRSCVH